ncbi:MAG: DUF58 domain-containing protein [Oscillospiraceae bacterium]|nr:DUF58 domain-containing protein [Oscillospiraceae bacterium]MCL2278897.1 DUF58 domain-containing protein [Oscillospiraceae bacterium]
MTIRRIIYILTLILVFFFYILYPPWLSWYLFVMLLLLPLFDLLISLPGMLSKTILLSAPPILEENAEGSLIITVVHLKSFPIRCVGLRLHMIGDDFDSKTTVYCSAGADDRTEIPIDTTKTGLTIYQLVRLSTISLLGLFSLKVNKKSTVKVFVLPPAVTPLNSFMLPRGLTLRPKPGGGFSEEHDIREYRSGDSIRSVHWKISAKYDELMVREPLVPPNHSRLIHIMKWNNRVQKNLILGRLRYLTDYLLERDMPFYVKYADKESVAEVTKEDDLIEFLSDVLDAESRDALYCPNLPTRFAWVYQVDGKDAA